jgi:hypothetical protein
MLSSRSTGYKPVQLRPGVRSLVRPVTISGDRPNVGLMESMTEPIDPLAWETKGDPPDFELHAKHGERHFVVSRRPDEQQWTLTLYSTFVKDPVGNEDQLDEYLAASQEDAKALAQGLVDQQT